MDPEQLREMGLEATAEYMDHHRLNDPAYCLRTFNGDAAVAELLARIENQRDGLHNCEQLCDRETKRADDAEAALRNLRQAEVSANRCDFWGNEGDADAIRREAIRDALGLNLSEEVEPTWKLNDLLSETQAKLAAETERAEEAEKLRDAQQAFADLNIPMLQDKLTEAVRALNGAMRERDALKARACVECALAYTECPRTIQLLDGGGPMDVDHCSEWQPREEGK